MLTMNKALMDLIMDGPGMMGWRLFSEWHGSTGAETGGKKGCVYIYICVCVKKCQLVTTAKKTRNVMGHAHLDTFKSQLSLALKIKFVLGGGFKGVLF